MSTTTRYTTIIAEADVTDEIVEMAWSYVEGWYLDKPIDWEDVFERMERSTLADGRTPDLGPQVDTPAMRLIKKRVRAMKAETT
jgi:hypothetical protein